MNHTKIRGLGTPTQHAVGAKCTWNSDPYSTQFHGLGSGDILGTMRHENPRGLVLEEFDSEEAVVARARRRALLSRTQVSQ